MKVDNELKKTGHLIIVLLILGLPINLTIYLLQDFTLENSFYRACGSIVGAIIFGALIVILWNSITALMNKQSGGPQFYKIMKWSISITFVLAILGNTSSLVLVKVKNSTSSRTPNAQQKTNSNFDTRQQTPTTQRQTLTKNKRYADDQYVNCILPGTNQSVYHKYRQCIRLRGSAISE